MDLIELKEMMKKSFKDKEIIYDFDYKCSRLINVCLTNGVPNLLHQIEFNQVKMTVEGFESQYINIQPHRCTLSWVDVQKFIDQKINENDVFFPDENIKQINNLKMIDPENFEKSINDLIVMSGLSKEKIESKLEGLKCE